MQILQIFDIYKNIDKNKKKSQNLKVFPNFHMKYGYIEVYIHTYRNKDTSKYISIYMNIHYTKGED